ncbi:CBS domain-containing protein [Rickettsiales endosymbiont of Peranema trichophorum]|uniref:hemolysin family protein n=1 Tax=Rickettsiales endosymbiont of Peranema trichophorum TaxID=2486577 RepID=UPI0010235F38|nr:transporter associated domain-containing protein [Rickettsiales endosymbiont of Peranema trichophorum]RZI47595.1 CBS domain-containing protein [Rickettsiales endosymbiont of Peranema trichophorum]
MSINNSDVNSKSILKKVYGLILGLVNRMRQKPISLEESVNELIKEHDLTDSILSEEKVMLKNFIDFRDLKASEVMVPRTDIIAIPQDSSFDDLQEKFIVSGNTRLPVYQSTLDDIVGFIHMKDFFPYIIRKKETFDLAKIMRELLYIPRSMKIMDLLAKMRHSRIHIAIIVDEYGGTDGLLTIEDIIEEIIGDIEDEHDVVDTLELVSSRGNVFMIDGRARITDIEERFGISFTSEEDDYETFGGFIASYLGRIPNKGEKFTHPAGLELEIVESDGRKVRLAEVKLLGQTISQ